MAYPVDKVRHWHILTNVKRNQIIQGRAHWGKNSIHCEKPCSIDVEWAKFQ